MVKLTKTQRRVLADLAAGGKFYAALRRSTDYMRDDVLFSEVVGIVVHPAGGDPVDRYTIRSRTASALYLAESSLVKEDCAEVGGYRAYTITDAGRAVVDGAAGVCVTFAA